MSSFMSIDLIDLIDERERIYATMMTDGSFYL